MRVQRYLRQIPNALTCARIGIAAITPFVSSPRRRWLMTAAMATEYLDGALARKFTWQSDLGRMLDPIADKVFTMSVAGSELADGKLSRKELLMLGARDLLVGAGAAALQASGHSAWVRQMHPRLLGKGTTALQYAAFFGLLFARRIPPVLLAGTLVMGLAAAVQYGRDAWKAEARG